MKKINLKKTLIACFMLTSCTVASAELSVNISAITDYSKRGITQTDNSPALQVGIDYSTPNDIYMGLWTSNLDINGNDTNKDNDINREVDAYLGSYFQISETSRFDLGITYYSYLGSGEADEGNHGEGHALFDFSIARGSAEINVFYSWDYLGLDASQQTVQLAYSGFIFEKHRFRVMGERIESSDVRRLDYEGESEYMHYQISYDTSYKNFSFEIKAENTDLKEDEAKQKIIAGISFVY